ncbi:MAG TPA: hypothetical protein VGL28_02460 [Steroidobacteraceae bacterium]
MTAAPGPAHTTHAADNSPFIVGLASHSDLAPGQISTLIDSVVNFLLELKQHLPATELIVMMDVNDPVSPAIAAALQALSISIESLTADAAAALVRRSSLLLALWDGRSSSVADDTADLVLRFLGVRGAHTQAENCIEISTVANELDVAARLVFWIAARRRGDDNTPPSAYYLLSAGDSVLDVQPSMPQSLQRRLADLNEYNQDFERFSADSGPQRSASLMRDPAVMLALSDGATVAAIDRQFVKADSLAGYMQRQSDRLFNLFGITAFTMGVAYLVYDKITESKALLMFYVLILFVSLLIFYFFQTKRWFGKYLAYRALAETLRVRFYLAVAGIDRVQSRALITLTGISRFAGFGWICFVLDAIEPVAANGAAADDNPALRARLVDQDWIEDQYRYFVRKVAAMEKHRFWIGRLKNGVFIVVLIVLSVMFMFGGALHDVDARPGLPLKNVLTFFSGTLAVVLGVWELRQNKMAVQELLWQYRNQLSQYQRARRALQRISSRSRRDAVLEELGENSLMEIYLWAIHRYHREHAPPSAF